MVKMTEEPDDFEGKWPEGDAMSEWKLVPVEPAPSQVASGEYEVPDPLSHRAANVARNVYRAMLDAAPAAPVQQAEPVAWRYIVYGDMVLTRSRLQAQHAAEDGFDVDPLYLHPPPAEVQDGFDFREECDRRAHVIARLMSEAQRLREAAKATLAAVGDAPWILGRNLDEVTKALNELRRALEGE